MNGQTVLEWERDVSSAPEMEDVLIALKSGDFAIGFRKPQTQYFKTGDGDVLYAREVIAWSLLPAVEDVAKEVRA